MMGNSYQSAWHDIMPFAASITVKITLPPSRLQPLARFRKMMGNSYQSAWHDIMPFAASITVQITPSPTIATFGKMMIRTGPLPLASVVLPVPGCPF
jgi:hypothetical protein